MFLPTNNAALRSKTQQVALVMLVVGAALWGCTQDDEAWLGDLPGRSDFIQSDGAAPESPDASSTGMCASNECPAGRVTCPDEPFPCGVDLTSDDRNCGACGVRCPTDDAFLGRFSGVMRCVAGTCRMVCDEKHADCNGLSDDGCETLVAGPEAHDIRNCGACGNVCTDICSQGACGCPPGGTFCPTDGACHNIRAEEDNCGACGNVCPESTDEPFPAEWNVVRGCGAGRCNQPMCQRGLADCNGSFLEPGGDGCETPTLFDPENCGECGHACGAGENCVFGKCLCPCGAVCFKGLDSDPYNCGTCGLKCPGDWRSVEFSAALSLDPAHGKPICDQGVCGFACSPHFADCDGDLRNGCETDLRADPLNCGGCGVHCDGLEGQPCVDGLCRTKECEVR